MLIKASAIHGYSVKATDGSIGTVSDLLFDDASWTVRWLVVETGSWLLDRRVLLPVSALGPPDSAARTVPVNLTKAHGILKRLGAQDRLTAEQRGWIGSIEAELAKLAASSSGTGQAPPRSLGSTAVGSRGTWSAGGGASSLRFRTITQRTYSSTGSSFWVPSCFTPRVRT